MTIPDLEIDRVQVGVGTNPTGLSTNVSAALSQATTIEQTRAIEEVRAAIIVAQQVPRSMSAAVNAMRESCQQKGLAERAFYRYPRAQQTVTGPSIHLARELARCFGNLSYGISELARDDEAGRSEMIAFAWDLQTNTRNSNTFIVPHRRDKTGGSVKLVDLRDIYENNTNAGARRVREAIFAVLPAWFIEEAKSLCVQTLSNEKGQLPLATRIANMTAHFGAIGVTADQLVGKVGRPLDKWTPLDLATLGIVYTSLQRGEVTLDEEFPAQRVTAAEVLGVPAAPKPLSDDPDGDAIAAAYERENGTLL